MAALQKDPKEKRGGRRRTEKLVSFTRSVVHQAKRVCAEIEDSRGKAKRRIRKVKSSRPTEFGKLLQIQEVEGQTITAYEVYESRPWDSDLLIPAVETHRQRFGKAPRLTAADSASYSKANEEGVHERGVSLVAIPHRHARSADRRELLHSRWFKNVQQWRTGRKGRISELKRWDA